MALYAKVDCSFPDDPKVVEAGADAELVYLRCVLRARQHLTDGVIDRRVVARWCVGIRGKVVTHLARLVAVGLLEDDAAGWRIPEAVWRRWNPTKAEVAELRRAEAERKAAYRSRKRDEIVPTGQDEVVPRGRDVARRNRDGQPEPEPETETETETEHSSSSSSSDLHAEPVDEGDDDDDLWERVARCKLARAKAGTVADTDAWLSAVAAKERVKHRDRARQLRTDYPTVGTDQLAAVIADGGVVPPSWSYDRASTVAP